MQNKVNVTTYRKKCQQFQAIFEKPRQSQREFWVIGPESTELPGPQCRQSDRRLVVTVIKQHYGPPLFLLSIQINKLHVIKMHVLVFDCFNSSGVQSYLWSKLAKGQCNFPTI
jgi:hypothetical protein